MVAVLNCWEFKKCGREPGGSRALELGECPAAKTNEHDGVNSGQFGGRCCWRVAGTMCGGAVQGSFATKLMNCMICEFYSYVEVSEGLNFKI